MEEKQQIPKPADRAVKTGMVRVRALRHVCEDGVRAPKEVFEISEKRRAAIPNHLIEDVEADTPLGVPKAPEKPKV